MENQESSIDIFDVLRELNFSQLMGEVIPYNLQFKKPGKTSRGILTNKTVYYLKIFHHKQPKVFGIGECAPLQGLSKELGKPLDDKIKTLLPDLDNYSMYLSGGLDGFSSLQFALETALIDLYRGGKRILFPSKFTEGDEIIRINGLIWMEEPEAMIKQINQKLQSGFSCLKLKVGALDQQVELDILREIRNAFGYENLEIRLDANGAYYPENVMDYLDAFAAFQIHSIEQPIKQGQWLEMQEIIENSPIPIALDEELISINGLSEKTEMLESILPDYIILKPTLCGGLSGTEEWITLAEEREIAWWLTSALESNIGLNALAQYTFTKQNPMYQGLGTGQVFSNNVKSPLTLDGEFLRLDNAVQWELPI